MRADNSHHLVASAQRRSEATRERAMASIHSLAARGEVVSVSRVAEDARVSRAWLYTAPDVRSLIAELAGPPVRGRQPAPPSSQRASDASLLRRLELALRRVEDLTAENRKLRSRLEVHLGAERATRARRL